MQASAQKASRVLQTVTDQIYCNKNTMEEHNEQISHFNDELVRKLDEIK